jgi:hypothetical protein
MFLLKSVGLVTSKEVSYFGTIVTVPENTIAIATDEDGSICAYDLDVPHIRGEYKFWSPLNVFTKIGTATFAGNWEDSLMILE